MVVHYRRLDMMFVIDFGLQTPEIRFVLHREVFIMRRLIMVAALLLVAIIQAKAQSDVPRVEVGVQGSVINTPLNRFHRETFGGFGGRVTINVTRTVSFEGQLDYYPKDITNRPAAANEFREVKPDV